jgi:hypothetical protein
MMFLGSIKESSRFLKKAAQKLFRIWGMGFDGATALTPAQKSLFGSLSSEKEPLPSRLAADSI